MDIKHLIKSHTNVQTAGHIVMTSFAVASLSNIESFFANLHPGLPLLSWGLGVALGSGLLVMAGLLSGMVWDWLDHRFQVVGGVAGALALLSGAIQAGAYWPHMEIKIFAVIIGLALPIIGELGVALAVSAYTQAIRRQRMADAQSQLADGVRAQIGEAIAAIDKTKIEMQVNRAASLITKEIVDSTVEDMINDLRNNRKRIAVVQSTDELTVDVMPTVKLVDTVQQVDVTPVVAVDVKNHTVDPIVNTDSDDGDAENINFTERMVNGKRNKTVLRQDALLNILMTEFNGQSSDVLNKSLLAERLDTTRQTIGRDIEDLIAQQRLSVNGHIEVL